MQARSVRTPVRFPSTLHYRSNVFQCRFEVSGLRFDFHLFCITHLICYVTNDVFFLELRLVCVIVELCPLMGWLPVLPMTDKWICSSDGMIIDRESQSSEENFSSALWPSKAQNGRASDSNRTFAVKIDLIFSLHRKKMHAIKLNPFPCMYLQNAFYVLLPPSPIIWGAGLSSNFRSSLVSYFRQF